MMNKIYTGIIYAGLTVLMVFAPLARGATTTRLWAITIVMFVMYTVVFAGLLKKVDENKKLNHLVSTNYLILLLNNMSGRSVEKDHHLLVI